MKNRIIFFVFFILFFGTSYFFNANVVFNSYQKKLFKVSVELKTSEDDDFQLFYRDSLGKFSEKLSKRKRVVSSKAGVDAIVAEGFEAGGHNGRDETTTLTLIPMVRAQVNIPLIAAGGIATGNGMMAAMALGADGVQIGSRFVTSIESSAHAAFKNAVLLAKEGDTQLTLKELTPVRLLKNKFYQDLQLLYNSTPTTEDLKTFLGKGRAKRGMFEGDLEKGELEIGQIAGLINEISSVSDIVDAIISEFNACKIRLSSLNLNNQNDE